MDGSTDTQRVYHDDEDEFQEVVANLPEAAAKVRLVMEACPFVWTRKGAQREREANRYYIVRRGPWIYVWRFELLNQVIIVADI